MSTPVKRKPQSPTPGSPDVAKAKTSTPGATSPEPASPGAASPAARTAIEPTDALPGSHWLQQGLPQLDDGDDTDSSLGSDADSSTASISSSILNYRTINGRTYHSDSVTDGEYWGPNDSKHIEALDIIYHACDLMLGGKLHQAPLVESNLKNAVDIGTGSGIWAIDFADKYNNCKVVGTDISPVQPSWVPPNLEFEINDATKEWTFREDHFDFIHMQFLNGAFGDLTEVYKEAYRCCKPGGWLEHSDLSTMIKSDDGTVLPESAWGQWGKLFDEAGKKIGKIMAMADNGLMEKAMRDAGFINVEVKNFKMPTSPWPRDPKQKEVGLYYYAAISSDAEGVMQFMFGNVLGWTQEQIAVFAAHARRELKDMSIHGYVRWQVVYGQKPE
ncbi:S-adenosyl-L-methionine-dependent methyltransferase [Neurospora tetraspora]|uniref:S-adenosyl-L-methionine-dependent methyltransferase n=1 Tax=Neurospora tetraspora TaxID=94610 RepID=A0AAE0JAY2_9PEZI|nr:S-adenosyl-L-methionine-dependent methyltransferase [Neurospora tetraspora]